MYMLSYRSYLLSALFSIRVCDLLTWLSTLILYTVSTLNIAVLA